MNKVERTSPHAHSHLGCGLNRQPQIAGFLEVIFYPVHERCNKIRLAADCSASARVGALPLACRAGFPI